MIHMLNVVKLDIDTFGLIRTNKVNWVEMTLQSFWSWFWGGGGGGGLKNN
jgi:hypothetical protein